MNGLQARMARAALNFGVRELKVLLGVSTTTLQRIEEGDETVKTLTIRKVRQAYERAGVEFSADGRGVKLRAPMNLCQQGS
jgi:transcriptional regulator with XRE-family HTH domain